MYLDYDKYKNIGGELSEAAFNRSIIRAESYINNETVGRLKKMNIIPDTVLYCLRDLVDTYDKIKSLSSASDGNVSSWSNDGVSVSYNVMTADEQIKALSDIVSDYLSDEVDDNGTPLLYRGVSI